MRLIAHRGNLSGVDPKKENTIKYIKEALSKGFDVEIDVRLHQNSLYLGHDHLQEKISIQFLLNKKLWVHCKTPGTYIELSKHKDINCFYQEDDLITKTNLGYFWLHSKAVDVWLNNIHDDHCEYLSKVSGFSNKSVIVCLDYLPLIFKENRKNLLGLCSDYVYDYSSLQYPETESCNKLPFDLLILDIDGIMTPGTKTYDTKGNTLSKTYCDQDFTAIKRFKAAGVKVCFLSGDKCVNEGMAKIRGIDFHYSKDRKGNDVDKSSFLLKLSEKYKVSLDKIAYVGDDYYDLTIIEKLTYTFCAEDSLIDVKERVHKVLPSHAGKGVVAKLYEEYRHKVDYAFPHQ